MSNTSETTETIMRAKATVTPTGRPTFTKDPNVSTFSLTNREVLLDSDGVAVRSALRRDGALMWEMAKEAGGIDLNSPYAYMMQARNFSETCVIAEVWGSPAGFITAHRVPERPTALFVWQVAVLPEHRGLRIGQRMLENLVEQPACFGVRSLEATVTPSNKASEALFSKFAESRKAELTISKGFAASDFPEDNSQETEKLFSIQPIHHVE